MTLANGAKRHAELAPALHCTAPHTSRHARRVRHRSTIQAFGCRRTVQRMRVPIRRKRRRATTTVVVRNRAARGFALARAASRNHARHLPIAPCSALPMQARSEALGGAPPPRTQSRNESASHACTSCAAHRCVVDARRSMLAGRHQQADTRRSRTPAADRHALAAPAHSTVDDSALRSLGGRFTKQPALSSLLRAPHDARGTSRCRQPAVEHHATTWHRIVTASARRSAAIERRMSRCLAATSPRSPLPATSDNVHSRRHSTAFAALARDRLRIASRLPRRFLAASSPLPRASSHRGGLSRHRTASRPITPNHSESGRIAPQHVRARMSTSARPHARTSTRLHVRTPMRPHGIASRHITSRRAQTKKSPRAFARGDFFGLSQLPDDSGKPHAVLTLPRPSASSAREPSRARWPASPGTSALRP